MIAPEAGLDNGADRQLRDAFLWWDRSPHRLWSLLEMLDFSARRFVATVDYIAQMELMVGNGVVIEGDEAWREAQARIGRAADLCEEIGMRSAADALRSLVPIFRADSRGWPQEQHGLLRDARARIEFDLRDRNFLAVAPERISYYENAELFGPIVAEKFGKASDEIKRAGTCHALDQPTACVFHLMRVMELAVQRFARRLGVSVDTQRDTWDHIMGAVNGKIKTMPRRDRREQRKHDNCASISAHLNTVRIAWRNPTMHPKKSYSLDQAKDVLESTGAFLRSFYGA
jgi:hypothetical protein